MKPIAPEDRCVANIRSGTFEAFVDKEGRHDGDVLQVNPGNPTGYGFHVYRMAAGHTTTAHEHIGDEEFLMIEGELVDQEVVPIRWTV